MRLRWRGNFIGGRFRPVASGRAIVSEDPGDLDHPVGTIRVSLAAVDEAVAAAAAAQGRWAATPVARRARALKRFQRAVRHRAPALSRLIAREMGKPLWEAKREVDRLIARVDETITDAWARVRPTTVAVASNAQGECRFKPRGVLAVLGPFNFPAHLPCGQIVPGLLAGNTVVFKPSELTPFVGQSLAECMLKATLPAGVFNLVQGGGNVGALLVQHPAVQGILFTGSAATGRRIQRVTLDDPKKLVALEMGGKNAAIVLDDADMTLAARETAIGAFSMAGQRGNATSRIILHRRHAAVFLKQFLAIADGLTLGYQLDPEIFMGPLVSRAALEKYQAALAAARREGYDPLRPGGPTRVPSRRGYYVRPSVHLWPRRPGRMPAAARYRVEEIFGPDVAIYLIDSVDDAVAVNNEVPYGLVTSVFTRRRRTFETVFRRVDTGLVNWNRGTIVSAGQLPFGGTKASGNGRPAGAFAIESCVYPVAVLGPTPS